MSEIFFFATDAHVTRSSYNLYWAMDFALLLNRSRFFRSSGKPATLEVTVVVPEEKTVSNKWRM